MGKLFILGLGLLLGVAQGEVLELSVELVCTLPCLCPNVHCKLSNINTDGIKYELSLKYVTSFISGLFHNYDYSVQKIVIYDLTSGTRYNYCVTGLDSSDEKDVQHQQICDSFTTTRITQSENKDGMYKWYTHSKSCSSTSYTNANTLFSQYWTTVLIQITHKVETNVPKIYKQLWIGTCNPFCLKHWTGAWSSSSVEEYVITGSVQVYLFAIQSQQIWYLVHI